jgi:hypothetical protein
MKRVRFNWKGYLEYRNEKRLQSKNQLNQTQPNRH